MHLATEINHEAAILARVLQADEGALPVAAARAFLKLGFGQQDRNRMHELTVKNQADTLTKSERSELESYLRIGRLVDLLWAQARRSLRRRERTA